MATLLFIPNVMFLSITYSILPSSSIDDDHMCGVNDENYLTIQDNQKQKAKKQQLLLDTTTGDFRWHQSALQSPAMIVFLMCLWEVAHYAIC
ncbi:unnamed protein product [Chironomus riparius]|uniref:Uncharacterized protein n=1 Tax=Chironomus riparius TaxID=315576 RepID=A0A9N9RYQ0_9DIPT|nr:unnamed protein product [Chironomus riparius]